MTGFTVLSYNLCHLTGLHSDFGFVSLKLYHRKKKDKSSKEGKRPVSNEKGKGTDGPTDGQDEPKEVMKESEILLLQRLDIIHSVLLSKISLVQ